MAWTLAACAVWAGLALANPTTTYHLAPSVAVLMWPLITRGRRARAGWRHGLLAAAGATLMVALTTLLLLSRDALAGPALIGPNATVETILLTAAAAVVALVLARPRHRSCEALERLPASAYRPGVETIAGSGSGRTAGPGGSGSGDRSSWDPERARD